MYCIIINTRGPGRDFGSEGSVQAAIGAVAAATGVSEVHLVSHQHWKRAHSPVLLSLLSAKHVRLHPLSLINPMHGPLKLPLK
jgi:hypothetical protein